ncbi:MAG TPA: hypothetical protein GXX31_03680 [Methanothermobacter sp.]|jgi:hypothetical protein|uniref:Serine protease n=1 Tax=Methanothermobacter tenebrarum TaxID=680118 RepID=A0ABN6PCQ1_9EURY|nr:SpoIVB peptidase S55 domain-containing protein [Methanothermobacter tenebrarum]MDX9692867.1 SpoIVB peptidase S55 domain-containing protein [Methanothermobacter sp.]BDH79979.1 hypothetical protein MTTB_13580 [Methanothermobacter tenebrarum]HHW16468.1 hypothetical protein [Methanothermobacter sp.]HOQ19774.1 SpoIVB peptidase S55 domain-containing protein [Methanothermobacter sp.]
MKDQIYFEMCIGPGSRIRCNEKEAVVGAIIPAGGNFKVITVQHLLKVGGCHIGDPVYIGKFKGIITRILYDLDLAIADFKLPSSIVKLVEIGSPRLGPAYSLNKGEKNYCTILSVGRTYHYLAFAHRRLPLPGDSGSPIIQDGKVVGILSSVFFNSATAIASSLERFL